MKQIHNKCSYSFLLGGGGGGGGLNTHFFPSGIKDKESLHIYKYNFFNCLYLHLPKENKLCYIIKTFTCCGFITKYSFTNQTSN